MNKKIIISAIVICLLVFVAVLAFTQNSQNVRWEYTIRYIGQHDISDPQKNNYVKSIANKLGEEGWELTSVLGGVPVNNITGLIFKRRLP